MIPQTQWRCQQSCRTEYACLCYKKCAHDVQIISGGIYTPTWPSEEGYRAPVDGIRLGGALQVPGVGNRAVYLHTDCATTFLALVAEGMIRVVLGVADSPCGCGV